MIHTSLSSTTTPQNALDIFAGMNDGGAPHALGVPSFVRFTNSTAITINGILAPTEYGVEFKIAQPIFCVVTNGNVTLTHNSASASVGRKIFTQAERPTLRFPSKRSC